MKCEFEEVIRQDLEIKKGDAWSVCHRVGEDDEILETHVVPIGDTDGHQWRLNCHCDPYIEYEDEEGEPYGHPIIAHNAFDGRHLVEEAQAILGK